MRRRGRRHTRRLQTAMSARAVKNSLRGKRRGLAGQRTRRQMQRAMRRSALVFTRWAEKQGLAPSAAAGKIGMIAKTLSRWQGGWARQKMPIKPVGRPAERADPLLRDAVIASFGLLGPGVGLTTLRWLFPEAARAELEDLIRRYRRLWKKKNRALVHALRWEKPGAVWSMDFFDPPAPIDGIYRYVLVVRDLAARNALLALPCFTKEPYLAVNALKALFAQHGAPLVMKSDNGFDCHEVIACLEKHSVLHLLNPPALPSYNGACEAGIGALKTETHWESVRQDRPGKWTCDDLEAARLKANQTHLPWGRDRPPPHPQRQGAKAPTPHHPTRNPNPETRNPSRAKEQLGVKNHPGFKLDRQTNNAVNRYAISRALESLGQLSIRRRRITLRISKQIQDIIS